MNDFQNILPSYFPLLKNISKDYNDIISNETKIIKKLADLLKLSPLAFKKTLNKSLGVSVQKYNMLNLLGALIENIIDQMKIETNFTVDPSTNDVNKSENIEKINSKMQSKISIPKKSTSYCTRNRYDMWGKRKPKTYQEILKNRLKFEQMQQEQKKGQKKFITSSDSGISESDTLFGLDCSEKNAKTETTKNGESKNVRKQKSFVNIRNPISILSKRQKKYSLQAENIGTSATSIKINKSTEELLRKRKFKLLVKEKIPVTALISIPAKPVNKPSVFVESKYRTLPRKRGQKTASIETENIQNLYFNPKSGISFGPNIKSHFSSSAAFQALMKKKKISSEDYLNSKEINTQTENKFQYFEAKSKLDRKAAEAQKMKNYFKFARMITKYLNIRNNLCQINDPFSLSGEMAKKHLNSLWFCKKISQQRPINFKQKKPEFSKSAAALLKSVAVQYRLQKHRNPRMNSVSCKTGKKRKRIQKPDLLKNTYPRLFSPINAEYPRKDTKGVNNNQLGNFAETSEASRVQNSYLYKLTYGDKMSDSLKYLFGSKESNFEKNKYWNSS